MNLPELERAMNQQALIAGLCLGVLVAAAGIIVYLVWP